MRTGGSLETRAERPSRRWEKKQALANGSPVCTVPSGLSWCPAVRTASPAWLIFTSLAPEPRCPSWRFDFSPFPFVLVPLSLLRGASAGQGPRWPFSHTTGGGSLCPTPRGWPPISSVCCFVCPAQIAHRQPRQSQRAKAAHRLPTHLQCAGSPLAVHALGQCGVEAAHWLTPCSVDC